MNFFKIGSLLWCCLLLSCQEYTAQEPEFNLDYRQEMRNLVIEISNAAKAHDLDFIVIPQNGIELITEEPEAIKSPALNYLNAIDGVAQEDLFFGYPSIDQPTPNSDNRYLRSYLDFAKEKEKKILIIDYSSSFSLMDASYRFNKENDYTSYAAPTRELSKIPDYQVYQENNSNINTLSDTKNFLYLLNFSEYGSKQDLLAELRFTNYDLIVLDLFFEDEAFTKEEIQQLKQKKNGGKRLVLAYMSIGEAEDYRYYWKNEWKENSPQWLVEENPDWEGNYKVKYWDEDWEDITYKNEDSYLKKIINSGFDGVYLDIIDGFLYFEDNY